MEIISGLKQTCLETTAMWENSTVLPDYWLVSASPAEFCAAACTHTALCSVWGRV